MRCSSQDTETAFRANTGGEEPLPRLSAGAVPAVGEEQPQPAPTQCSGTDQSQVPEPSVLQDLPAHEASLVAFFVLLL